MSGSEKFFRGAIRVVFLCAYGAFLWASLHHIAYFFHSFEPDQTDWTGSYWLAISIDVTALVMTTGVMFFRKGMGNWSFAIVWFFILGLTSFSWVVNWEYAVQFQNNNLSRATDFQWINPILASSFAFLNLVYSIVGEFFNAKPQTAEDLDKEIARLEALNGKQKQLKALRKGTGFIAKVTETVKEFQEASAEILASNSTPNQNEMAVNFMPTPPRNSSGFDPLALDNVPNISQEFEEDLHDELRDTPDEIPAISVSNSSRGKYYMTYEEASEYTGYKTSYLKGRVTAGVIRTSPDGSKLLVSSLSGLRKKVEA